MLSHQVFTSHVIRDGPVPANRHASDNRGTVIRPCDPGAGPRVRGGHVQVTPLAISGCSTFEPPPTGTSVGLFLEWLRRDLLEQHVGHPLDLRPGQLVDIEGGCAARPALRRDSARTSEVRGMRTRSNSGTWWLTSGSGHRPTGSGFRLPRRPEQEGHLPRRGLGHGFMALTDDTDVVYLCSAPYAPVANTASTRWIPRGYRMAEDRS